MIWVREAIFSHDNVYRYKLSYVKNLNLPTVMFVLFNPTRMYQNNTYSPTTQRLIKFAESRNYGQIVIGNIFSYISPDPYRLLNMVDKIDLIGPSNDSYLKYMALESKDIYYAWGNFPFAKERQEYVANMLSCYGGKPLCVNRNMTPAHPLSINFKF